MSETKVDPRILEAWRERARLRDYGRRLDAEAAGLFARASDLRRESERLDAAERVEKAEARVRELEDDRDRLRDYFQWTMQDGAWEGLDIYGGDAQDKAVELGLLVGKVMDGPCCEDCHCAYTDAEFPTTCYRFAWTEEVPGE